MFLCIMCMNVVSEMCMYYLCVVVVVIFMVHLLSFIHGCRNQ
jgi:hypothetical protein